MSVLPPPTSPLPAWTCPFCALLCDDVSLQFDARGTPALVGGQCPRASAALARFDAAPAPSSSVDGQPVPLDQAIESAAGLLRRARLPLIGGLGGDVAGARAWMRLAEASGAICDAAHSAGQTAALRVLQDRGGYFTSLAEIRTHADLIVVVGSAPGERHPRLWQRIAPNELLEPRDIDIVLLGVAAADDERARIAQALPSATVAAHATADLHDEIAVLSALVAQRQVESASEAQRALAERLRGARYAVLLWEPGALPQPAELAIELLQRTISTLNLKTRAAGFSLGGSDGAASAQQVHAWQTGLPLRTRHGPLGLEHDPWRNGTDALLADGAIDALVWIASHGSEPAPPADWAGALVLIGHPSFAPLAQGRAAPSVFIPVATPGIDHGGHQFRAEFSVLMPLTAAREQHLPSVAEVVSLITPKVAA